MIKIEFMRLTDTQIFVGFRGVSWVVTANIKRNGIILVVEWLDVCWDIVRDFDTYPKRVTGGYACTQCPEDNRPIFSSLFALRCAEVLEPFLEWVNKDLANAAAVSISGIPDEATWARLVPSSRE